MNKRITDPWAQSLAALVGFRGTQADWEAPPTVTPTLDVTALRVAWDVKTWTGPAAIVYVYVPLREIWLVQKVMAGQSGAGGTYVTLDLYGPNGGPLNLAYGNATANMRDLVPFVMGPQQYLRFLTDAAGPCFISMSYGVIPVT